jgi:hypothetical protein
VWERGRSVPAAEALVPPAAGPARAGVMAPALTAPRPRWAPTRHAEAELTGWR